MKLSTKGYVYMILSERQKEVILKHIRQQQQQKKLTKEIKELIKNDDRFKEYIQWNF